MKRKPLLTDGWRERWLQFGDAKSAILHRASNDVTENEESDIVIRNYTGTTLCGRFNEYLIMPGLLSRSSAPRCKKCCALTGIPQGEGCPQNFGIVENFEGKQ